MQGVLALLRSQSIMLQGHLVLVRWQKVSSEGMRKRSHVLKSRKPPEQGSRHKSLKNMSQLREGGKGKEKKRASVIS
jgi:hypothetical protein